MKKESAPAALSDVRITHDLSSRWRSLASMTDEHLDTTHCRHAVYHQKWRRNWSTT